MPLAVARRGFTLIELLVVIAIIALLSSVVVASLTTARSKARDAKRKTDLKQIQIALESFFSANGYYPGEYVCDSSKGSDTVNPCSNSTPASSGWDVVTPIHSLLVPTYIKALPIDPVNSGQYYYNYEPNGPSQGICPAGSLACEYTLWTNLEHGGDFCLGSANPRTITCNP